MKHEFGIRDSKLIHISEIDNITERGKKCRCVCPNCGETLIAKKGPDKAHHFSHDNLQCDPLKVYESALHIAAKEIIQEHKKIKVPDLYLVHYMPYYLQAVFDGHIGASQALSKRNIIEVYEYDSKYQDDLIVKAINGQMVTLKDIQVEKKVSDFIPDIITETVEGVTLAIEIAVTHFIDEDKRHKIRNAGVATIEIDLSDWIKESRETFNRKELTERIVNSVEKKKWIHSKIIEKKRGQLLETMSQFYKEEILQEEKRKAEVKRKNKEIQEKINYRRNLTHEQHKEILNMYKDQLKNDNQLHRCLLNMSIPKDRKLNCCNVYIEGELIFLCDRRIWQTSIFEHFIRKGNVITLKDIFNWTLYNSSLPIEKDLIGFRSIRTGGIPTLEEVLRGYLYTLYCFKIIAPIYYKHKPRYNVELTCEGNIHALRKFKVMIDKIQYMSFKKVYPCVSCGELVSEWEFLTSIDTCFCKHCYDLGW